MNRQIYILSGDFIELPDAVADHLLLEEYVCWQATLADLSIASADSAEQGIAENGGIFLRADATFDPAALAKAAAKRRDNFILAGEDGGTLGYVLDPEYAQDLNTDRLQGLPRVTLRHSTLIGIHNYKQITAERAEQMHQMLEENGVFAEDGAKISPLYDIAPGVFIGSHVVLSGRGRIGADCAITGDSRLTGVVLGKGVTVKSSVLLDCKVGDKTTVGPFAYLRPGTRIGKNARIGDFVEIKNSVIDDGTKISHLTYVGDSDVGKRVNFGCGTVISNYDGLHKHRTRIGDGAFIGCNTNLIAPVSVGNNAYTAAGSTITEDVPDEALAIARERQTNKPGWVKANKPELIK